MHCAASSTPPHFVVHVMKMPVQSALTHTRVDSTVYLAQHMSHVLRKWNLHIV